MPHIGQSPQHAIIRSPSMAGRSGKIQQARQGCAVATGGLTQRRLQACFNKNGPGDPRGPRGRLPAHSIIVPDGTLPSAPSLQVPTRPIAAPQDASKVCPAVGCASESTPAPPLLARSDEGTAAGAPGRCRPGRLRGVGGIRGRPMAAAWRRPYAPGMPSGAAAPAYAGKSSSAAPDGRRGQAAPPQRPPRLSLGAAVPALLHYCLNQRNPLCAPACAHTPVPGPATALPTGRGRSWTPGVRLTRTSRSQSHSLLWQRAAGQAAAGPLLEQEAPGP
jgi:hypothetical protein